MWKVAYAAVLLGIASYSWKEYRATGGSTHSRQQEIEALTSENAKLREAIHLQHDRIDKLDHDQNAQELEIRKRLKLVKPNETEYILQDEKTDAKAAPAAR